MDASSPTPNDDDFDPSRRRLCPDGACIGVIGEDGRCSVCGRTEAEAADGAAPVSSPRTEPSDTTEATSPSPKRDASDSSDGSIGFDPTRRLCEDGACVGVVGDDGVCRTCGRRSQ